MSEQHRAELRPTRNPARAVYGTVLAGSLIVAERSRDDVDLSRLTALVLITQVVYWLAHVYSELVAVRIEHQRRPTGAEVRALLNSEWSLVAASFAPLTVIEVSHVLGGDLNTCVMAGLWSIPVILVGWAFLGARRSRMGRGELLAYVALSALFGVALVALKALIH